MSKQRVVLEIRCGSCDSILSEQVVTDQDSTDTLKLKCYQCRLLEPTISIMVIIQAPVDD